MKQFFKDSRNKYSMVRLIAFMCAVTGLILALVTGWKMFNLETVNVNGVIVQPDTSFISAMTFLVIAVISLGIGAKVSQKWKESDFSNL